MLKPFKVFGGRVAACAIGQLKISLRSERVLTVLRKIELLFCRVPVAAALRQTAPIANFLQYVELRVDHGPIVDLHVTLP